MLEKFAIPIPKSFSVDKEKIMDAIKSMQGADLDKYYMETMISEYIKTASLFNTANNLNNPELRNFAGKANPILSEHQKLASQ